MLIPLKVFTGELILCNKVLLSDEVMVLDVREHLVELIIKGVVPVGLKISGTDEVMKRGKEEPPVTPSPCMLLAASDEVIKLDIVDILSGLVPTEVISDWLKLSAPVEVMELGILEVSDKLILGDVLCFELCKVLPTHGVVMMLAVMEVPDMLIPLAVFPGEASGEVMMSGVRELPDILVIKEIVPVGLIFGILLPGPEDVMKSGKEELPIPPNPVEIGVCMLLAVSDKLMELDLVDIPSGLIPTEVISDGPKFLKLLPAPDEKMELVNKLAMFDI